MTKLRYLITSPFSMFKRERFTAVLAVILLVVSTVCSLFLLSYGYSEAVDERKRSMRARCWIIETDASASGDIEKFKKLLTEKYDVQCASAFGECQTPQYGANGKGMRKAVIASELVEKDPFTADYGNADFGSGDEVFVTGGITSAQKSFEINSRTFKIIGIGFHDTNSAVEELQGADFFVTNAKYEELNIKTEKVSVIFKKALAESEYDSFAELVGSCFNVTDINIPAADNNEKIQNEQLAAAIFIMCLSFINVYAVFSYIFEKCKKDYRIMRLCGATVGYVFLSAVFFYGMLILISFAVSCVLYCIVSALLINTSLYYSLGIYVALVGLAVEIIPAVLCLGKLRKNCGDKL